MLTKEHFKNVASLVVTCTFCFHANAREFFVTDTNDTTQISSLRGAIIAANRMGGTNTIILGHSFNSRARSGQWIYRLTISGARERAALTGDLNITQGEVAIVGVSSDVTIDATGLGDRMFQVSSNAHLTLENLTIKGGAAPQGEPGEFFLPALGPEAGGAIYNAGFLTLHNCVITNNSSGDGAYEYFFGLAAADGGGIYNHGWMQAKDCMVVGNACGAGVLGSSGGNGGGIKNDGFCKLSECIINGNQAGAGGFPAETSGWGGSGGSGGGIFNSGTLTMDECIIGGNAAGPGANGDKPPQISAWGGDGGRGGGIFNEGELEIGFSTIYGNYAGNGGDGGSYDAGQNAGLGGSGGGIFNSGKLKLSTSTVSGNSCGTGGNGGSAYVPLGAPGGAGGSGGGIYNSGSNPGSFELTSSTISLNACGAGGIGGNGVSSDLNTNVASGGNGGDGGGIANYANQNAAVIRNTLIAQNLGNSGGAPGTNRTTTGGPAPDMGTPGTNTIGLDVAGDFASGGFNLVGTGDGGTGLINGLHADKVGSRASPINPLLGPLQMNGGFTPTHALNWGSPAIDQGNCFRIHRDQRGHHRPHILSPISIPSGGDGTDIGAFELHTLGKPRSD